MIKVLWKTTLITICTTGIAAAATQGMPRVGTLTCSLSPSDTGPVLTATSQLSCHFENSTSGRDANFTGRVKRLGVDRQRLAKFVLVWAVHTDQQDFKYGDLEGDYAGSLEPEGTLAEPANGLVGGNNKSIQLSPITEDPAIPQGWGISFMTLELSPLKA